MLGLGGIRSAALLQLAERGAKVCGFDQHVVPHEYGSSHGTLRVIRKAYFEHPDYVPLLNRAYELWDAFDQRAGGGLFVKNGLILSGPPESASIRGLEACYAAHDLPHEELDAASANQQFAPYRTPEDHAVFYDPEGGYLRVENCVAHSLELAKAAGAEIHFGEQVETWESGGLMACVVTDQETYFADHLILAQGAWSELFLEEIGIKVSVTRKMQVWYGAEGLDGVTGDSFPCFAGETDYGFFYGFPPVGADGLKIAEHTGGRRLRTPEDLKRDIVPEDETDLLRFLGDYFPKLHPHRTRHSACLYTNTEDGDFIIDRHPEHESVVFAAGLSGHGYKFAPVIAEALTQLALDGETMLPIGFLGTQRFFAQD